jgi:hypothetical protein
MEPHHRTGLMHLATRSDRYASAVHVLKQLYLILDSAGLWYLAHPYGQRVCVRIPSPH